MEWQELESIVRQVASFLWECEAKPEVINGVNIDCVLSINEMGHFLNRTLLRDQAVFTSSLGFWL